MYYVVVSYKQASNQPRANCTNRLQKIESEFTTLQRARTIFYPKHVYLCLSYTELPSIKLGVYLNENIYDIKQYKGKRLDELITEGLFKASRAGFYNSTPLKTINRRTAETENLH